MKKQALQLAAILAVCAQTNSFGFDGNYGSMSTDDIERELARVQSMNYHSYNANNTGFGFSNSQLAANPNLAKLVTVLARLQGGNNFDADVYNFDADAMNFNGLTGFGFSVDEMLDPNYLKSQGRTRYNASEIAAANLTTFKIRIIYTPVAVTPAPVRIQLFGNTFGETFTYTPEGNLEFTNAGGDTVLVQGLTRPMRQLYNVTDTEPFRLAFARITPQSISQLDNPIRLENQTQWNSGKFNEINPDIYNDPYQFQQLNIDVPFNVIMDKKNGFLWDIDVDQTTPGIGLALFISQQLKPADSLMGKPAVRNLNNGNEVPFSVPQMAGASTGQIKQQLASLANQPNIQQLLNATPLIKTRR